MADKHADEGYALMRAHSCDVRNDKTDKHAVGIFKGRSDALCVVASKGFGFEAKYGKTGFKTRDKTGKVGWKPEQRAWAEWFTSQNSSELFFWLVIGNRIGGKTYPRRAYIIPYPHFKAVIDRVEQYQDTLPYQATKGKLKEQHLDCVTQFRAFELIWRDGQWHIPNGNPIHKYLRRNVSCQKKSSLPQKRLKRSTPCLSQRSSALPMNGNRSARAGALRSLQARRKTAKRRLSLTSRSRS